jgi:hypothetical protein
VLCGRTRPLVHVKILPVDVLRAAERKVDHADADRVVRAPVDDDEGPRLAIARIRIKGDRRARRDIAEADLVELQRLARHVFKRVDVDLVL